MKHTFRLTTAVALACILVTPSFGADLPIRQVVLYKHGVGYFERTGDLRSGDTARLDFKAGDMNDVLKSLTVSGVAKISGIRYDASEPLERRLENFPFAVGSEASLASFLDQMKGARLELRLGPDTVAGSIISARATKGVDPARPVDRESVVLLTDSGEIRTFDLSAATSVKLSDTKLQGLLRDYLAVLGGSRSRDRRSVYLDAQGAGRITASYMTPSPVWKSSYRLIFGTDGPPVLEGWAIVDNTSGEDWTNVNLAVVSGKPISFITQLYEPRYVQRPGAELAENRPVGPVVYEGEMDLAKAAAPKAMMAAPPRPAQEARRSDAFSGAVGSIAEMAAVAPSSITASAQSRDLGELFEYRFSTPVSVKQGESAMLPFLQQKLNTRKLLIYSESYGLNPMSAAELTNSTGKTLDGGPITVYDAGAYAGEALVETVKAGDKRLISYGVDLGTRVTTNWDSSRANVREIHFVRGVMTTKNAVLETKTYSIKNVDANAKTIIIEHPIRQGFKLIDVTPAETTANSYRFEVKLTANGTASFAVKEERVYDQTISVTSMTPDVLATWIQNQVLSANGKRQLEAIAAKKREIAANDLQLNQVQADLTAGGQDQDRIRRNIDSLRSVAGQDAAVQQYARQLSTSEARIAVLRDQETQVRRQKATLQAELTGLIEKAEF